MIAGNFHANRRFRRVIASRISASPVFVEAFLWLGAAHIALRTIPFRWILKILGLQAGGSTVQQPACNHEAQDFGRLAGRALTFAAARAPWKSNCATKAVAAAGMLRLRRIPALIALGVKTEPRPVTAHAWLSAGAMVVTGAPAHLNYRVIATFAYTPKFRA